MQMHCMNITAMGGSDASCNGVINPNMTQLDAQAALRILKALDGNSTK